MTATVLMCPPDWFGVRYEINPWMSTAVAPEPALALRQWLALTRAYHVLGVQVEQIAPDPAQPDLVFTANAGLVLGDRFVLSRFRHPERQGEEPLFRSWAERAGFRVLTPPDSLSFEGAGDALFSGDTLVLGHGFRTDAAAAPWLADALGVHVLAVELVDPRFYHLDTCFCPLGEGAALAYRGAFTAAGWAALERLVPRLVAVPEAVAVSFACNALRVGDTLLISGPAEQMEPLLAPLGLRPWSLDMSEFRKSGGAVRCLTLPLRGLGAQPRWADGIPARAPAARRYRPRVNDRARVPLAS